MKKLALLTIRMYRDIVNSVVIEGIVGIAHPLVISYQLSALKSGN